MNDTPNHIQNLYRKMIMARSPSERLAMACRMFATAKALVIAGVRREVANPSPDELRQRIFLRFYGDDFTEEERRIILTATHRHS
jgi:hypothetical protein